MEQLITQLKHQILDTLNIEDVDPNHIDPSESLFEGELGLDSIDVLELIVLLEKSYGIKVESAEKGQEVFQSIQSIAEYIQEKQTV